jgi:hypothetical protein
VGVGSGFLIDQSFLAKPLLRGLPNIIEGPWNAKITTGFPDISNSFGMIKYT